MLCLEKSMLTAVAAVVEVVLLLQAAETLAAAVESEVRSEESSDVANTVVTPKQLSKNVARVTEKTRVIFYSIIKRKGVEACVEIRKVIINRKTR